MLCYARAVEGGAGEEGRRRDEGTGEGAKEVARTAGGEAAGARTPRHETPALFLPKPAGNDFFWEDPAKICEPIHI